MSESSPTSIDLVNGLRAFADAVEAHPEIVPAHGLSLHTYRFVRGDDAAAELAHLLKVIGGTRTKAYVDGDLDVKRDFGGGVALTFSVSRDEVCERRQVGTEIVEQEEVVTPAVTRTVKVEQPIYEWECSPVLAKAQADEDRGRAHHDDELDTVGAF